VGLVLWALCGAVAFYMALYGLALCLLYCVWAVGLLWLCVFPVGCGCGLCCALLTLWGKRDPVGDFDPDAAAGDLPDHISPKKSPSSPSHSPFTLHRS